MITPITIDDHDPRVKYSGIWLTGGSTSEVDKTTSYSTNVGDSFTLQFNGTQIGVHGTIDSTSGGVVTSYAIDGGTAAQATSPVAAGPSANWFNQTFWTSPLISPGDHTLVVTMLVLKPTGQYGEGTIWFDYFLVTPDPTSSSTSSYEDAIAGGFAGSVVFLLLALLATVVVGCRRVLRRQREKTEKGRYKLTMQDGSY